MGSNTACTTRTGDDRTFTARRVVVLNVDSNSWSSFRDSYQNRSTRSEGRRTGRRWEHPESTSGCATGFNLTRASNYVVKVSSAYTVSHIFRVRSTMIRARFCRWPTINYRRQRAEKGQVLIEYDCREHSVRSATGRSTAQRLTCKAMISSQRL